jgi:hypothetical protein
MLSLMDAIKGGSVCVCVKEIPMFDHLRTPLMEKINGHIYIPKTYVRR